MSKGDAKAILAFICVLLGDDEKNEIVKEATEIAMQCIDESIAVEMLRGINK